jgi:sialidase-1
MDNERMIHTDVFIQGEEGCHTYRIPSLVQSTDGTLIALAEGRRDNAGDPGYGHIDLFYKVSYDRGANWSTRRFFDKSQEGWSASNPTSVVEGSTGRIYVLFNRWMPGYGGENSRPGTLDNQLWMRYSDNNGDSWSEAIDITEQGRDIEHWGKVVAGPGSGIETSKRRLIAPVYASVYSVDTVQIASFALYSDDSGHNWKQGRQIDVLTNENQIVELDDGRLLMDARQGGKNKKTRWLAISNDQGEKWSKPVSGQTVPPICASIIRYKTNENNHSVLLWSGLKGPDRNNMVLRLSKDQGKRFSAELMVSQGPAAYSNMTALADGDISILWEGGKEWPYEKIIFTRIPHTTIESLFNKSVEVSKT